MEGSITFLSFSISIGIFLGISLGLFLLFNKSVKNKSNIYLVILLFCSTLYLVSPFVYFIGYFDQLPHLYRIGQLTTFTIGPIIYLYVRTCIQKKFEMRPILWLHFIPFVINSFIHIPVYTISAVEKIEYFRLFMETGVFHNRNGYRFIPIISNIHSITYGVISVNLILKYRKHLGQTASFVDNSFHQWLLVFVSILGLPFLTVFLWLISRGQFFSLSLFYFTFVFFKLSVFASLLFKPELFHAFPNQMPIPDSIEEKTQKYESSNLQEDQKEKYLTLLQSKMSREKYYSEPELTIQQLSDKINIPTYYLSQIINEKLNVNFLDFINQFNTDLEHYSINAIGFEAGFNSKSTFYTAFKKFTNTTPGKFRKRKIAS